MTRIGKMAGWKQALLLAVAFHVAFFGVFLFSPTLWHKKVRMPPVYNVQLFEPVNAHEAGAGKAVRKVSWKPAVKKHVTKKAAPKVSRAVTKKTVRKRAEKKSVKKTRATASRKKATSLKPKKTARKKVKKRPQKKKAAVSRNRRPAKKVNEERELSRRIKRIQEKVREKHEEQILKERLASLQKKVQSGSGAAAAGASGAAVNDALRHYAGAIWMHVRKNWHFPEELLKRKDLEAIVSIRVDRKGHIMNRNFEKRSGFPAFDRSVLKAVNDSDPLPPLPPQLLPGPVEIGIRFNPSRMSPS